MKLSAAAAAATAVRFALAFAVLAPGLVEARNTQVEFDPTDPRTGPFPTDFLTVPDTLQRTGRRVNLPAPVADCAAAPSDCAEVARLNLLDGFSPSARLTLRFSGPIDPESLRDNVYVAWLDPAPVPGRFNAYGFGKLSPVNQLLWDPATNTAYAKPDEMLEQTRAYLLVVTTGVRDAAGDAVEPAEGYRDCAAARIGGGYCTALAAAAARLEPLIPGGRRIAGASLFTTQSVTAFLEDARGLLGGVAPQFRRTANALDLANLRGVAYRQHVATAGTMFSDVTLPVPGQLLTQAGVGRVAFGSFRSPQFYTAPAFVIPPAPTAAPLALPAATEEVHFHAWLPRAAPPAGGYPVIIAGHGLGDSRAGMPTVIAAATGSGFAVVAISAVGHGYGPLSTYRLTMADGSTVEAPAPGRGVDVDRDGRIAVTEGCIVPSPLLLASFSDCNRQTVVDLMQLARTLREGVDLDGDGRTDLNGLALHYYGQSMGGAYGTLFTALEPGLRASVLNVAPGSFVETARTTARADLGQLFQLASTALRQPALTAPADVPFRNEPVRIRASAAAGVASEFVERMEWLDAASAPMSYGPYLRTATLPGVALRPVLFQYAHGDLLVPNQSTTALIRAANMREFVSFYRADIARSVFPSDIPRDVHTYLIPGGSDAAQLVAAATLAQGFQFLAAADGQVANPNSLVRLLFGRNLFETPEVLPETPNYPPAAP